MRIHILVEGRSDAALLVGWFPRSLPKHLLKIIVHEGKGKLPGDLSKPPAPHRRGLLDQLPAKLRAYGQTLDPQSDRVLVLVDADDDNCEDLKDRLLETLDHCNPPPAVLFRIAVEETEAFYLGDSAAVKSAFPQAKLFNLRSYTQDSVCGTWEYFQDVIGADYEDKVDWAEKIAPYLTTQWRGRNANRSPSFRHFCKALLQLAGEPPS